MRPFLLALLLCAACTGTPAVSGGMGSRAVSVVINATPTISALIIEQAKATALQGQQDAQATQDALATQSQYTEARRVFVERQESISLTQGARVIVLQAIAISLTMTAIPIVATSNVESAVATRSALAEAKAHQFEMNQQAEQDAIERGRLINGAITAIAFVVSLGVSVIFVCFGFGIYEHFGATPEQIRAKGEAKLLEEQARDLAHNRSLVIQGKPVRNVEQTPAVKVLEFIDLCISQKSETLDIIPPHTAIKRLNGAGYGGEDWSEHVKALKSIGGVFTNSHGTYIKCNPRNLRGLREHTARRADEIDRSKTNV